MPVLMVLTVAAQIVCGIHAVRSNRVTPWLYLIIFLPAVGCAIYFFTQIVPELAHSRAGRQVAGDLSRVANPEKELRRRVRALDMADTVENKRHLAEECVSRGLFDEAAELYERSLAPPFDTDTALLMGLARARFGQGEFGGSLDALDRLREVEPNFQSADGHLLYARALDELGRTSEAEHEYVYLVEYYPGEEARLRYALLLDEVGNSVKAQDLYRAVVDNVNRGNKHYFRAQREWFDIAKRRLRA